MSVLSNYIVEHTVCVRAGTTVDNEIIDVHYFGVVVLNSPNVQDFVSLTKEHPSEVVKIDFSDERSYTYIEIGGWLDDQGMALRFMALGQALGVFDLTTPTTMGCPEPMRDEMAGIGYVMVEGVPSIWKRSVR